MADSVEVEVGVEIVGVVVVAEEEDKVSSRVQAPLHHPLPATKVPNTQIFRQGSGKDAPCISNSGGGHTFVLSHPHAHGKMCSRQDLKNETGTSPKLTPI